MCYWVRAMDTYAAVFKLVEPKRLALAAAQVRGAPGQPKGCPAGMHAMPSAPPPTHCPCRSASRPLVPTPQAALDASNAVLAEKRARLGAAKDEVAALQRRLAETQAELASLNLQARCVVGDGCFHQAGGCWQGPMCGGATGRKRLRRACFSAMKRFEWALSSCSIPGRPEPTPPRPRRQAHRAARRRGGALVGGRRGAGRAHPPAARGRAAGGGVRFIHRSLHGCAPGSTPPSQGPRLGRRRGKRAACAGRMATALPDVELRCHRPTALLNPRTPHTTLPSSPTTHHAPGPYRRELLRGWLRRCGELGIPCSPGFTLAAALAAPLELRDWLAHGLPSDDVGVESGALVARGGGRWPLMVDPQGQGAS
jgi:hypothetical protein